MTRLLLSVSDTLKKRTSPAGQEAWVRNAFNFFYAVLAFRLFTFVWLYWTGAKYQYLLQRPPEIFWYDHALPNLVMSSLPEPLLFYIIIALAAIGNAYQLLWRKSHTLLQAVVALSLLWLNLALWGYGFLSHINHVFLLAHLFLVFIPVSQKAIKHASLHLHQSINWFYAGLLFTYTLAGLWKIPSLLYRLLLHPDSIHWLHPKAALVNAFVSWRSLDLEFTLAPLFTDYSLFWQVSYLVIVYLQACSVFCAYRLPLRPWLGLMLLVFHVVNMLAFQIYFVVASFVIVCLFTPYDLLFRNKFKAIAAEHPVQVYTKENGEVPARTPFEKLRTSLNNTSYYLSGPLYLPGLRTLANLATRLKAKF